MERVIWYIWIFLTASNSSPITISQSILSKFKYKYPYITVRMDQVGELGRSHAFQAMVVDEGFRLEMTSANESAQNTYPESPNKYIANMMHCVLHAADLGTEYWSVAFLHSVYIKNRLPHTFIKMTP